MNCTASESASLLRALLDDNNQHIGRPLHCVSTSRAVFTLFALGVDLDGRDNAEACPLNRHCNYICEPVVKALLQCGAPVNSCDSDHCNSLIAACTNDHGVNDTVLSLLEAGVDLDCVDSAGQTALMYAVLFNNIEVIQLLLSWGADTSPRDEDGVSAYDIAVQRDQSEDILESLRPPEREEMVIKEESGALQQPNEEEDEEEV